MPNKLKIKSYFNWVDILLPYRLWLKGDYAEEIIREQTELLPKEYSVSKAILIYRKKIGELNQKQSLSNNQSSANANLNQEFESINSSLQKNNLTSAIVGGEAALFLGYDVIDSFQSVDQFVYEGMSRMTGDNLDNIADLSSKVQSYDHNFWEGLTDAGLNKVGGHIGEAFAASSLEEKGFEVDWANESNQTGWDLLVNGHEMNVKTVADANSLSQHFNLYPDIPVIIPGDAANIPGNAINLDSESGIEELNNAIFEGKENIIAVDPSISHQDIMMQTGEATDFLTGSMEIFDSYIPLITASLSGLRELKLLSNEHTTVLNAAKNIGLDMVGTGGGGLMGATIGGAIGSILPVAGTVVGSVLGGVVGAIYGRKGTDYIKKRDLLEAYDEYMMEVDSFNTFKSNLLQSADSSIAEFKTSRSNHIKEENDRLKTEIKEMAKRLRIDAKRLYTPSSNEIMTLKNKGLLELKAYKSSLNSHKAKRNKWKAIFLPDAHDFAIYNASKILEKLNLELVQIDEHNESKGKSQLIKFLSETGLAHEKVLKFLSDKELIRYEREDDFRVKIDSSIADLVKKRHKAITEISEFISTKTTEVQESVKNKSRKVQYKMELFNIEKQKLGLQ